MHQTISRYPEEDKLKGLAVVAVASVDAVWIAGAGYTFDWSSSAQLAVIAALLYFVAEVYRRWRPIPAFEVMTRETTWLLLFTASAALLSNLTVTLNRPLIDPELAAFGKAVGFDWMFWHGFVSAHPWLNLFLSFLYFIALPQVAFAVVVLALLGRLDRVREFVLALMIGAILAITISALFPSSGALAYYRPVETAPTIVDLAYKQSFFDLRAGLQHSFSLTELKGLIAFPSYHATLSVLVVMAFRGMPRFFWPLAVFNLLILASAPVEGGHFLIDVVGGTGIALIGVWLAGKIRARLQKPPVAVTVGPVALSEMA